MTTHNDLPSVGTEDARAMANYALIIIADSGYESTTEGRCSAAQYGAAVFVLQNEGVDLVALTKERDELASRVAELETEVLDQCRLNGMGAERESALMGRVRELESAALAAQPGAVSRDLTDEDMDAVVTAIAGLNRGDFGFQSFCDRIIALAAPTEAKPAQQDAVDAELETYDAGLLNDFGGGNVEWWQDYIRAELGRAHDFYQTQFAAISAKKGG